MKYGPCVKKLWSLAVLVVLGSWSVRAQCPVRESAVLDPPGVFGPTATGSAAVSGVFAVVGAPRDNEAAAEAGAVYLWEKVAEDWVFHAKLLAPDASPSDRFGQAVALQGDVLVVGAPHAAAPASSSGAVYVFERSNSTWQFGQKLAAADGSIGDLFGSAVVVEGDTLVVGAPQDTLLPGSFAGSAYVFTRPATVWGQTQKLTAPDATQSALFGSALALSGTHLLVGAPGATGATLLAGAGYLFGAGGGTFAYLTKLVAGDGFPLQEFGYSVALEGATALVGAPARKCLPAAAGAAYWFDQQGAVWPEAGKVQLSAAQPGDRMGASCSLAGGHAAVGAPGFDGALADSGVVALLGRDAGLRLEAHLQPGATSGPAFGSVVVAAAGEVLAAGNGSRPVANRFRVEDFSLSMTPELAPVGTNVQIEACGGPAGRPWMLFITSVDRFPTFRVIPVTGLFNLSGGALLSGTLQSSPGAVEVGFRMLALRAGGGLEASQEVFVRFL